ncbi:hypothetical protein [Streptomyces sp. NPDC050560]|uniref:hypothetical protein n=1 Tax=Streptomyces sp. NPDC050560 TaxID=3365630 RepID=UPI0037B708C9
MAEHPHPAPGAGAEPLVLDLGGLADLAEVAADLDAALARQRGGPLLLTWPHGAGTGPTAVPAGRRPAEAVVRVGDLEVVVLTELPGEGAAALAGMAAAGPWSGDTAVARTVLVVADPRPPARFPQPPTQGETR